MSDILMEANWNQGPGTPHESCNPLVGGGGRESIRGGARRHKGFTDAILFSCFNILSESLSQRNSITRNKSAILLAKQECTAGNNNSGDYNAQHHSNRCHGNDSQVRFRQRRKKYMFIPNKIYIHFFINDTDTNRQS